MPRPPLPARAIDWLPFLWTRVLFPAAAGRAGAWRWRPFLLVLFVPAVLLYPCLSFALFEPDAEYVHGRLVPFDSDRQAVAAGKAYILAEFLSLRG